RRRRFVCASGCCRLISDRRSEKRLTSNMRRSFRLPRVYPITDTQISGLSHAQQVALFAAGGATLVQLRDKHATGSEFYEQAKAALAVAAERGVRLVINDRVDVALALGGL